MTLSEEIREVLRATPAGRSAEWALGQVETGGASLTLDEIRERIEVPDSVPAEQFIASFKALHAQVGGFVAKSVQSPSDLQAEVILAGDDGKRWLFMCQVSADDPPRIRGLGLGRPPPEGVEFRLAVPEDAEALRRVDLGSPIELGDTLLTIDHGEDYFAAARLMEEVFMNVAVVDGVPGGVEWWSAFDVRAAGRDHRLVNAFRLRVLPEHQRKGLWSAGLGRRPAPMGPVDGIYEIASTENAAVQHMLESHRNRWTVRPQRVVLPCAALAGPSAGRAATAADADTIVRVLNAFHGREALYMPYTIESFTARVERSPSQYSWDRVLLGDGAVVGVWPSGEHRTWVTGDTRRAARRALVLDFGCEPGADGELERLLRAWCASAAAMGIDELVAFTSEPSPGFALLSGLASYVEPFDLWTPSVEVPADVTETGVYVDHVTF